MNDTVEDFHYMKEKHKKLKDILKQNQNQGQSENN